VLEADDVVDVGILRQQLALDPLDREARRRRRRIAPWS
jgi:hypothetical protein